MKLIVGLGNIGEQYKNTRHNIGFIFIDEYLKEKKLTEFRNKYKSEFLQTNIEGEKIFFQKPSTYVNLSGEAISEAVRFYKLNPKTDLFVIYDDMDMEMGKIKIKNSGSAGGHNGIKSIISHLGNDFVRIKYGIGKAKNKEETIGHVLGKFSKDENEIIEKSKTKIIKLIDDIINGIDVTKLMNKYNGK